jgi:hypothetical protein
MKFIKPPAELVERFKAALPSHPDLTPKQMFGFPASFVKGNFFTGLHNENVVIRLPDEVKAELKELDGAPQFDPMGGRPMKQWWVLPSNVTGDGAKLKGFIARAFVKVQPLPGKAAKPAKKKARK